jgi:thymidylate kinase
MPAYPNFVLFEGLDGSGKTTLARAFSQTLADRGYKIFDLAAHGKNANDIPLPWPPEKDLIFSAEPTHSWVGAAIRAELIRNGADYDGKTVAEAYSLDRYILYRRFLLPMLRAGALVVSDRNAATSIVYQPIMENALSLEEVLALPGNKQALEHAPGHLVIAMVPAKVCIERINARADKKDDAVFEKEAFLTKAAKRYESDWFRELWEKHGTQVYYLDANQPMEQAIAASRRLAEKIFPSA